MLWKCCTQYVSKCGKLSSGHRTRKRQFSFQSLRKEIPKKSNARKCSNYCTIPLISHTSKVLLKILQPRLQQYMNCELPDVQAGFKKAEEPEIQLPASAGLLKKQEFQKNIYFCFIDYAKAVDCVDHNKLWKILKEMGIPDHLTCLLRKPHGGQKKTVRTGHRTID